MELAADNFNRGDENPLASPWAGTVSSAQFQLLSQKCQESNGLDCCSIYNTGVWPDDQYSQAVISSSGTTGNGPGPGVCLRASTGVKTFYRVVADHGATNNVEIGRFVSGTYTTLKNATYSWNNGDLLKAVVQGSTVSVYINDVFVTSHTDVSPIASGKPGIAYSSTAASSTVDTWSAGDLTAPASNNVIVGRVLRGMIYQYGG